MGARGGLVTLFAQAVSMVTRVVGLVILARMLAPEVFGIAAIAVAITTFVSAVIFLGLPMATAQAATLSQPAKSGLFIINLSLGILLGATLLLLAGPIADWYGQPSLESLIQWLAIVPVVSGIQSQFRLQLVRSLRFTALAFSDVVAQLVSTASAVALAANGTTYGAIIAQGLVYAATQFLIVVLSSKWIPTRPGGWRSEISPIVRIGLNIFGSTILRDGTRSALVPIMANFVSPADTGSFDRAQQLSVVPVSLTVDQLQRVAVPVLSQMRTEPVRLLSYMRRAHLIIAYSTGSLFLLAIALAGPMIEMFLGPSWSMAATILQFLAVGAIFRALIQAMQWLFISSGKTSDALRINMWTQPFVLFVSVCGLPWGVAGVAAANSAAWVIVWPVVTISAARAAGLEWRPFISDAIRVLVCFGLPVGLAAASAHVFALPEAAVVLVGMTLALVIGAIVVTMLAPVRRDVNALRGSVVLAMQSAK